MSWRHWTWDYSLTSRTSVNGTRLANKYYACLSSPRNQPIDYNAQFSLAIENGGDFLLHLTYMSMLSYQLWRDILCSVRRTGRIAETYVHINAGFDSYSTQLTAQVLLNRLRNVVCNVLENVWSACYSITAI